MKSSTGTNDAKYPRQIDQLLSAPSPRKARRGAANRPIAQAAAATSGPNDSQGRPRRADPSGGPLPLDQRQGRVSGRGPVALGAALQADALGEALDLLGGDVGLGQLGQVGAGGGEGGVGDAGVDHLVLQGRAVAAAVKAQAAGLR